MRCKAERTTSEMIQSVWDYRGLLCVAYDGEMYFVAARREFAVENGWYKREPVVEILVREDLECIDPTASWGDSASGSVNGSVEALLSQLNSAESKQLHTKELELKLDNLLLLQSA